MQGFLRKRLIWGCDIMNDDVGVWFEIIPSFPDSIDCYREIEVKKGDEIIKGTLIIDEWVYFAECEEGPIFHVITDDDKEYSFTDFDEYRFLN